MPRSDTGRRAAARRTGRDPGAAMSEAPEQTLADDRSGVSTPEVPAKPKHDPGTSGFWWIPGGMLAAAAVAILVWWVWPPNNAVRGLDRGSEPAVTKPLPDYVLETDGGLAHADADELSHRYLRETKFEWVLRPRVDASGEVAVRGFAFVDGGRAGLPLGSLAELVSIADSGTIRITGSVEQLDLEPGRYTIALAVGRVADLPSQAADVLEPAADAAWQVRRIELEIEG
jgi:hypothetical protein